MSVIGPAVCPRNRTVNLAIQTNSNIKGIKVGDEEIKNTLYADDTTLFVKDLESVQELLEMLEKFRRCSGLELNKSKTEAMWLGSWAGRKDKPFPFPMARSFNICFRYSLYQR